MCNLSLGRGKHVLMTGAAGVLLGLPLTAGDAPAPLPIAPVSATTPATPVAAPATPNFQSQQYNQEVQRQLNLLYQQDPQAVAAQPALPKPPAGPPQPKKMRMKDWLSPTAWKRYNRSRQRVKEYEERQQQSASNAPDTDLGKPSGLTVGGAAPLAPAAAYAPELAAPRTVTPPAAPPAIVAAPPAVVAAAPRTAAVRPQLERVSPEIFELPGASESGEPPVFDFNAAATTPAPTQGQPRLLRAPDASDAAEAQTPTLTILPEPASAGTFALRAAPPAELAEEQVNPPQETDGFLDEPAFTATDAPVADDSAEALFGAASTAEPADAAELNPFDAEAAGPYSGLELQDNPFAAPEPLPAAGPEARVTAELPTFATDIETPAPEPVAALLAPPPSEAADEPVSAVPTRLATDTTTLAAPALLPIAAEPARITATNVSASTAPTDVQQKLSRISERRGLTGFKGFCPVTLRDDRELADAKLEHTAQHEGRQYWFSSAAAKDTFLQNPTAYVPARGGIDVVIFDEIGEQKDGSLDNAVWYRGQLYLFSSSETQAAFTAQPQLHQVE